MDEYAALRGWHSVVGAARLVPMDKVSNPVWRVIAEDGRQWVLKHLSEFPPGAGPVDEFRVLCYLQAAGLPVAVPTITDDGLIAFNADNLRTDLSRKQPTGKHAYSLLPLLANDPGLRESPQLAHTIGAGIGQLDQALARCPWPVTSFTDNPAPQILTERYPGLPQELRALTTPLRDRLYAAIIDLPTQLTHGDCNTGNVLVHAGAITGYIDLDHLPTGPRIRDLSYYLVSRLNAHLNHGSPDALAAVLRHYVSGYHSEHPMTERELAAVVPMMLTVAIGGADWQLHGWAPNPAAYQRDLRAVQWLTRRYDELIGAANPA
jgi:Ser/Thr protein kinase RdoA (MazF antagonist)